MQGACLHKSWIILGSVRLPSNDWWTPHNGLLPGRLPRRKFDRTHCLQPNSNFEQHTQCLSISQQLFATQLLSDGLWGDNPWGTDLESHCRLPICLQRWHTWNMWSYAHSAGIMLKQVSCAESLRQPWCPLGLYWSFDRVGIAKHLLILLALYPRYGCKHVLPRVGPSPQKRHVERVQEQRRVASFWSGAVLRWGSYPIHLKFNNHC